MGMSRIDRSKLIVKEEGFRFAPFRPDVSHETRLDQAGLKGTNELLAFERNGERRVLSILEMAYHHVCQGELAGEPYLVTF
jgi:hypothetical protein